MFCDLVAWLVLVCMLVCLLFVFLIDLISGGVFSVILLPVHRVFYRFVFFEGRFLIGLVFGGLWCSFGSSFVPKERQKEAERDPNDGQNGQNGFRRAPKMSQMATSGGARSPKRRVQGGVHRVVGKPSWGPEGAIIKEVWIFKDRIFGDLVIR